VSEPSQSRLERIARCLAYCAPEGAAALRLAEIQHRQELEAQQQFEAELAALRRELGWTSPGRLAEN